MALHISGDDRPGFAILDFKRDIGPEDLTITLKSKLLHFGEYLGSEGTWSETPCIFRAMRLPGKGQGVYRIGPEIVNRGGLALDFIEVCVPGAEIVEDVTWPVLPADPNAVPVHAVTTVLPEPAPAEEPEPAGNLKPADLWDEKTQDAEAEEARPAPEAAAIEHEPAKNLEPPESLAEAREEAPREPEAGDAGPSPEAAAIEPSRPTVRSRRKASRRRRCKKRKSRHLMKPDRHPKFKLLNLSPRKAASQCRSPNVSERTIWNLARIKKRKRDPRRN